MELRETTTGKFYVYDDGTGSRCSAYYARRSTAAGVRAQREREARIERRRARGSQESRQQRG